MRFYPSTSSPLLHYLEIFHDSVILVESIEELSLGNVNFDHTRNLWSVNFTFELREGESSLPNLFNSSSDNF